MLNEIGDPDRAEEWLDEALVFKRKIVGFGHRVYKHGDSRVPITQEATDRLVARAADPDVTRLTTLHAALRHSMISRKGIHPNLDNPAGLAYHLMGFDIPTFTPLFVMSRVTGWTAHITEQLEHNALIHPLGAYNDPDQRPLPGSRPRRVKSARVGPVPLVTLIDLAPHVGEVWCRPAVLVDLLA